MKKMKVLGIAPYANLALLMRQAAEQRTDLELTVYTGDLEEGVQIASQYTIEDYDFIISRGGTAHLIRQNSNIPVVEIEVSLFDLLRCMQIARNSSNHYALIGFPSITRNSDFIKTLLEYNLDVFTIHSQQEAEKVLKSISLDDYDVILSDSISNSLAQSYHFHTILITSGIEIIESTLNQIVFYGSLSENILQQNKIFRALLNTHPFDIYMFSASGVLIYHSREDIYSTELVSVMSDLVPTVLQDGQKKVYRKYSGLLASISGSRKQIDDDYFIQFYVNLRKVPLSLLKNGLQYKSKEEVLNNPDNLYINIIPQQFLKNLLKQVSNNKSPVFILAENGMEKQAFAEALYLQSDEQNNPLTIIDCARLTNNKNWEYLMEDMNSPLSDTGTTIYIKNIDTLTEQRFRELLSGISDTKLYKRNRLLFEMAHRQNEAYPERYITIQNYFRTITIEIPPLRESLEQIPHIANLLLNAYNIENGREIAGFRPDALLLLQNFDWPYNYKQLRRVIANLGAATHSSYIEKETVQTVLNAEFKLNSGISQTPAAQCNNLQNAVLNLEKPLDEITKDIINLILTEENGNQTAAAKRLGISRTTLWRMLK